MMLSLMSSAQDISSRLAALDPFFSVDANGVPEQERDLLRSVARSRDDLPRPERQVTFFGAFKAGKSTLLNSLIGAPLLPTRVNRATGVVTRIRFAEQPSAAILRRVVNGELREEPVRFDDARRYILLTLSGSAATPPAGVEEVRLGVPLPILKTGYILVDTPGLLEDPILTERCFRELERTDLAVMVMSADKILSSGERDAVRQMNDLLHGNTVFLLNRLNLVDREDRDEVIEWAHTALRGTGNSLVGAPRIFIPAGPDRLEDLSEWLQALLDTPAGESIAVLSRLGVLEHRLQSVGSHLQAELARSRHAAETIGAEERAIEERERAAILREIVEDRERLQTLERSLDALGKSFVTACLDGMRQRMEADREWHQNVRAAVQRCVADALRGYADQVSERARSASASTGLPVPEFDVRGWIIEADVRVTRHVSADIASSLGSLVLGERGKSLGANLGGWVEKSVFRKDVEREVLASVEQVARSILSVLLKDARQYVERIDRPLAEAQTFYDRWERSSPRLVAARAEEEAYAGLVRWCADVLSEVRAIIKTLV